MHLYLRTFIIHYINIKAFISFFSWKTINFSYALFKFFFFFFCGVGGWLFLFFLSCFLSFEDKFIIFISFGDEFVSVINFFYLFCFFK